MRSSRGLDVASQFLNAFYWLMDYPQWRSIHRDFIPYLVNLRLMHQHQWIYWTTRVKTLTFKWMLINESTRSSTNEQRSKNLYSNEQHKTPSRKSKIPQRVIKIRLIGGPHEGDQALFSQCSHIISSSTQTPPIVNEAVKSHPKMYTHVDTKR